MTKKALILFSKKKNLRILNAPSSCTLTPLNLKYIQDKEKDNISIGCNECIFFQLLENDIRS